VPAVTDQPRIVAVSTSPPDHGLAFAALTPGAPMKLFLSSMLHELHQPLVAIRLCAESGRANCAGGSFSVEKLGALFEAVGESVEMTLRTIGGLRGYVKGQEPTISPIDLNQAVSEVIRLAAIVARSRGIALVELLEPGLGCIWANRGALEQALCNLVFNAIEAIDEQGERRVSVSTRSAGDAIEVVVTDTGCGIPRTIRTRCSSPSSPPSRRVAASAWRSRARSSRSRAARFSFCDRGLVREPAFACVCRRA
jgi:signal transduction histidine kinase